MADVIKVLSTLITKQIAAGEVIERAASIVKELVENSIDAKSTNIIVTIEKAGNDLISVRDNGMGISKNDLPLAMYCHATSKLKDLNDLDTITSLGFRGEALASISAVAKVKITSQHQDAQNAYSIQSINNVLDETTQYEVILAAHPKGTTIEVRDLFYSTPVRRRFQKSEKTEYQYILDIFQKLALSNFDCGFTLINDNKVIYKLPGCNKLENAKNNRVRKIFGSSFIKQAVYFSGEAQGIALEGWIGDHELHRSQSDQQYFFLNNRIIRDKLVLNAIKYAYDGIIPNGRHPCYILYLSISPDQIDINVHPTKHEVRFRDSRWVHQFIVQQLTKVLNNFLSKESISLDSSDIHKGFNINSDFSFLRNLNVIKSTGCSYHEDSEHNKGLFLPSQRNVYNPEIKSINFGKIIGYISNCLVITGYESSYDNVYYIIDLEAAYCYFSYERLLSEWGSEKKLASHKLALEASIELSFAVLPSSSSLSIEKLLQLGIEIEHTDRANFYKITKVPYALRFVCPKQIIETYCEHLINDAKEDQQINYTGLFNKLARLTLGRLKGNLLYAEQISIIEKLSIVSDSIKFNNKKLYKRLDHESIQLLLCG
jgi:DNA mismatch repair protein MutL